MIVRKNKIKIRAPWFYVSRHKIMDDDLIWLFLNYKQGKLCHYDNLRKLNKSYRLSYKIKAYFTPF